MLSTGSFLPSVLNICGRQSINSVICPTMKQFMRLVSEQVTMPGQGTLASLLTRSTSWLLKRENAEYERLGDSWRFFDMLGLPRNHCKDKH